MNANTEKCRKFKLSMFGFVSLVFLIFVLLIYIFITFKDQIEAFNSACFKFTGELVSHPITDENFSSPKTGGTTQKTNTNNPKKPEQKKGPEKKQAQIDYSKPLVLKKFPHTPKCQILYRNDIPYFHKDNIPSFPRLRKETGENWDAEMTDIKITTDGKYLYCFFKCYDKKPENLVKKFSLNEGSQSAWKDDSIELFLMKNRDAKHYCQYVVSVSGKSHMFYILTKPESPISYNVSSPPAGFAPPEMDSEIISDGFEVHMKIDLSNIDFKTVTPNDSILMQIVRNYRGEEKDGVSLQLFPVYIYADSRIPPNNHDRRAFTPVEIKKN